MSVNHLLVEDTLLHVLSFVPDFRRSFRDLRLVCKTWDQVSRSDILWKNIYAQANFGRRMGFATGKRSTQFSDFDVREYRPPKDTTLTDHYFLNYVAREKEIKQFFVDCVEQEKHMKRALGCNVCCKLFSLTAVPCFLFLSFLVFVVLFCVLPEIISFYVHIALFFIAMLPLLSFAVLFASRMVYSRYLKKIVGISDRERRLHAFEEAYVSPVCFFTAFPIFITCFLTWFLRFTFKWPPFVCYIPIILHFLLYVFITFCYFAYVFMVEYLKWKNATPEDKDRNYSILDNFWREIPFWLLLKGGNTAILMIIVNIFVVVFLPVFIEVRHTQLRLIPYYIFVVVFAIVAVIVLVGGILSIIYLIMMFFLKILVVVLILLACLLALCFIAEAVLLSFGSLNKVFYFIPVLILLILLLVLCPLIYALFRGYYKDLDSNDDDLPVIRKDESKF